jgi:hypothetical protein
VEEEHVTAIDIVLQEEEEEVRPFLVGLCLYFVIE